MALIVHQVNTSELCFRLFELPEGSWAIVRLFHYIGNKLGIQEGSQPLQSFLIQTQQG